MGFSDSVINLRDSNSQVVSITVFVAVLCLCLVIGHLFQENRWVNESITAILVGCVAAAIILVISKGRSSRILRFDEELFFIYLLPPIIFNAGFHVKKKQFFHNCFTIILFGVLGVFISSSIISAGSWWLFPKFGFVGLTARDYLGIGTIFSSTDTVCTVQVLHQEETPLLYSLVFGEGVVNDATSVVLFNAVQKLDVNRLQGWAVIHVLLDFLYLFSTSTVLGIVAGLLTAYILKGLYFGRHCTVREIALMVLMAYLSYMLAEVVIWWAGLMRGAVSIALAFKEFTNSGVTWDPVDAAMVTTTVVVVLFSTIVFGFLTKPLVSYLLPSHANSSDLDREPSISKEDMKLPLLCFEESAATNVLRAKDSLSMLVERPVYTIHHYWRRFDDACMRPIFGGPRRSDA